VSTGNGVTALSDSGLWAQHGPCRPPQRNSAASWPSTMYSCAAEPERYGNPAFREYSTNIGRSLRSRHARVPRSSQQRHRRPPASTKVSAPGVNLVSVRVLDGTGQGTYLQRHSLHSGGRESEAPLQHPGDQLSARVRPRKYVLGRSPRPGRHGGLASGCVVVAPPATMDRRHDDRRAR